MSDQNTSVLFQWPLVGGIDERTRAEVTDPATSFLVLENVRQASRGGYSKRKGYTPRGSNNMASAWHLTARDRTPLAVGGADASRLYAYSQTETTWNEVGRIDVADVARDTLFAASDGSSVVIGGDLIYVEVSGKGYLVAVVQTTTLAYGAVYEAASLTCLCPPTALGAFVPEGVRVVAHGTNVTAIVSSGGSIYGFVASVASLAAGNAGAWTQFTIANDCSIGDAFDADAIDASTFVIAYVNTSGGASDVTIKRVGAGSITQTATRNTGGATVAVGVRCRSTDTLWLAYTPATTVGVVGYDPDDLTSVVATGSITGAQGNISRLAVAINSVAGEGYLVAHAGTDLWRRKFFTTAGTVSSFLLQSCTTPNAQPISRPCNPYEDDSGRLLVWTRPYVLDGTADDTAVCVDLLSFSSNYLRPAALTAPRQLDPNSLVVLPQMTAYGSRFLTGLPTRKNASFSAFDVIAADVSPSRPRSSGQVAFCTFTGGGAPHEFDGVEAHEVNFVTRPPKPFATAVNFATNVTTSSGGYRYIAVYAHADANGQIHRSAPSDPSTVTGNFTAKAVNVTVATLGLTSRQRTPVAIELYRTEDGGATYYAVQNLVTSNAPSANTVTLTDYVSDSILRTGAQLYRQPSVADAIQPHACPAPLRYLVVHGDRLVGVADDGITLWYSAKHVLGEGMWFADLFQFPVEKGGRISGLVSQDGRLYVFKRGSIFVVDGDGPAENGANGDFSQAYELPHDVGCVNHRSLATCVAGTVFQSDRGIELLSRGGGVSWIGEPIVDTLAAFPIVTSATVVTKERLVLLTLAEGEDETGPTGNGVTLAWDYSSGLWVSRDRVTHPTTNVANAAATCSAMVPIAGVPTLHWADSAGRVYSQQSSSLDGANWVTAKLRTAWVKLSGLLGEHTADRVTVLADKASNHDVTCSLAYEYRANFASSRHYLANEVSSIAALGRQRLEVLTGNDTRGTAICLQVEDATPTKPANFAVGTGAGATWVAIGVEGSARRKPPGQPSRAR